jgi:hypothetical protein
LPRFIDVQDDAKEAAVAGVGGAFASGIALAHAQWFANGASSTPGLIAGYGTTVGEVYGNASGWPVGTAAPAGAALTVAECQSLWGGLLQGGAPTVSGTGPDYVATTGTNECIYTYQAATTLSITYNYTTGAVVVDDQI